MGKRVNNKFKNKNLNLNLTCRQIKTELTSTKKGTTSKKIEKTNFVNMIINFIDGDIVLVKTKAVLRHKLSA